MGATSWSYFTPYQDSPEIALQRLRLEVFENRQYGQARSLSDPEAPPDEQLESLAIIREMEFEMHGGEDGFDTIDELLESCAEEGTHSILDILRTGKERDFAVAFPAPAAVLKRVFGTTEPTREQIEAVDSWKIEDEAGLQRWESMYLIVYEDGDPSEYFFVGHSGD